MREPRFCILSATRPNPCSINDWGAHVNGKHYALDQPVLIPGPENLTRSLIDKCNVTATFLVTFRRPNPFSGVTTFLPYPSLILCRNVHHITPRIVLCKRLILAPK